MRSWPGHVSKKRLNTKHTKATKVKSTREVTNVLLSFVFLRDLRVQLRLCYSREFRLRA
jgi:hypothetical protein